MLKADTAHLDASGIFPIHQCFDFPFDLDLSVAAFTVQLDLSEAGFLRADLCEYDGVGPASRQRSTEETVHGFERDSFGLGYEEVDEYCGANHEAGEEEVDAVAHCGEHLRGEAGDDEVPEPVL